MFSKELLDSLPDKGVTDLLADMIEFKKMEFGELQAMGYNGGGTSKVIDEEIAQLVTEIEKRSSEEWLNDNFPGVTLHFPSCMKVIDK